jgi:hypothetical protein
MGWWAPQPVWTIWRSENSRLDRDSNPDPAVIQPVASHCTDWATRGIKYWLDFSYCIRTCFVIQVCGFCFRIPGGNNKARVWSFPEPVSGDRWGEAVSITYIVHARQPPAAVRVHRTHAGESCLRGDWDSSVVPLLHRLSRHYETTRSVTVHRLSEHYETTISVTVHRLSQHYETTRSVTVHRLSQHYKTTRSVTPVTALWDD